MILSQVSGHLGSDPTTRTGQSGASIVSFRLASTSKNNGQDLTTWVTVTCFGKTGEYAQSLAKGDRVFVWGKTQLREFVGKNGENRVSLDLNADGFSVLKKADAAKNAAQTNLSDEEIPF